MHILGFDIGGTKIEATLLYFGEKRIQSPILDFEYQNRQHKIQHGFVLHKKRVPTERHLGYRQIIKKMATLAKEVCEEAGCLLKEIKGIGLSVPGPVNPETHTITASNSMVMAGHQMHLDLKSALKLTIPVHMENDANCFALCEVLCGAGLTYFKETKIPVHKQTAVGVILGSGCGGGIVVNGDLVIGRRGGGGEIGHMTLDPHGPPCYCGRRGCAEQYLCAPALEALANTRLYSQIEGRPNAQKIFELYKIMDPIALAVVKEYKRNLAFFLGSLTCGLDPHYFVFGGGLSLEDVIYQDLEHDTGKQTYLSKEPVRIFKHIIGDSAGAIGAGLIAKNIYESRNRK